MYEQVFSIYGKLKSKDKKALRERSYLDSSIEVLMSMFNYGADDDNLKKWLNLRLEMFLRIYGKVAFTMHDGALVFGRCHYASNDLNAYGEGDKVIITLVNGVVLERTIDKDVVVMRNNKQAHSELSLQRFVYQVSNVDMAEESLLSNTQNHPIITARDEETLDVIKNTLKDTSDGKPLTVACSNAVQENLIGASGNGIEVVNINDVQNIELFQYYSHYHLDLEERFFKQYGLSTFNTGKMAQTNNLEVSGSLASSMAYPISNYHLRVEALEEIKKLFGIEISIEWGECWKNQIELMAGVDDFKEECNISEDEDNDLLPSGNNDESEGGTNETDNNN